MRTKKALLNVAGLVVSELVIMISGLILPRLILVAYGSVVNGLLSSIRQILAYLNLFGMGIAGASILALYKPLAEQDDGEISRVLSASRRFYFQVGFFFSVGAVIVAATYPFFVHLEGMTWAYVAGLVVLLAMSGACSFFLLSSLRVLLIADQRSYVLSLVSSVTGVASVGVMAWAILSGYDVMAIAVISAGGVLLQAALLHLYLRRTYGSRFRFNLSAAPGIIAQRWDAFTNELSFLLQMNSPVIIVTFMLGLAEVSVYVIYNMVFRSIQSMVKMLPRNLHASFGEIIALDQLDRLRQSYRELEYLVYFLTGWLYTCTGILLLSFVRTYTQGVTDANYIRPGLGVLFLVTGVVRQLQAPISTVIIAAGKYSEIRNNSIQVAVLGVVLGVMGAALWGLEGVLLGVAAASAYRTWFTIPFGYRKVLFQSPRIAAARMAWNGALGMVAWLPFAVAVEISPDNIWHWANCAAGVFVWVGLVFAVGNAALDWPTTTAVAARVSMVIKSWRASRSAGQAVA